MNTKNKVSEQNKDELSLHNENIQSIRSFKTGYISYIK